MTELRAGRSIRGNRDTYLVEQATGAGNCGQVYRASRASETLAAAIADGCSFEAVELTEMFRSLLESLRYLHTLSPPVFHRNVGPDSVILAADRAKLSDTGLAASGPSDPREDLYQLASVILFAATHRRIEEMSTRRGALDLAKLAPNLEPQLRRALAAALDPIRERRPASAAALLAMLDEWRLSPRAAFRAARGRRPRLRAALGAALLLVGGLGARAAFSRADVEDEPGREPEPPAAPGPRAEIMPSGADDSAFDLDPEAGLPTLTWRATVTEARGMEIGKECILELAASERAGSVGNCEVELRCGSQVVTTRFDDRACHLEQVEVTGQRSVYDLWLVATAERGLAGDTLAVDSKQRSLVYQRVDAGGRVRASAKMTIGSSESASRSGIHGEAFWAPSVQSGVVSDVYGDTPARLGEICSVTTSPTVRGENDCRVSVQCGSRTLYDNTGKCEVEDGERVAFSDRYLSMIDGSPTLHASARSVFIEDAGISGASAVEITLPTAAPR